MNLDEASGRHTSSNFLYPRVTVTVDLRCAVRLGYAKRGERQHQSRKREFIANHCQIVISSSFYARVVQSYSSYSSLGRALASAVPSKLTYCPALAAEGNLQ